MLLVNICVRTVFRGCACVRAIPGIAQAAYLRSPEHSLSMSLDAKILELRLLLKESSLGQASISKCAAKLSAYGKGLDNQSLEGLLRELMMNQIEFEKAEKIFHALARQSEEYDILEREIEGKISAAKESISQQEEELRQQKSIREHRMECEQIASTVNKHPSRSALKRKIDAINQGIDSTNASIDLVESEIALKAAHFKTVLQAVRDLQAAGLAPIEEEVKMVGGAENDEGGDANEEDDRETRGERNAQSGAEGGTEDEIEVDEDGNPIENQDEGEEGTEDADGVGEDDGKEGGDSLAN